MGDCPTCGQPVPNPAPRWGTVAELEALLNQPGDDGRRKYVYQTAADGERWCVTYTKGAQFQRDLVKRLYAAGRLKRVYPECDVSYCLPGAYGH